MKQGIILPGGNAFQFPAICANLTRRGIEYEWINTPNGGAIFRVDNAQVPLLPSCEKGHYIPTTEDEASGHGIYPVTDEMVEDLKA